MPLLVEYAVGLNPTHKDRPLIDVGTVTIASTTHAWLAFTRRQDDSLLRFFVETSEDLHSWLATAVTEISTSPLPELPAYERVTLMDSTSLLGTRAYFIRLRVTH